MPTRVIKRFLLKIYVFKFFDDFILLYPFYVIFMQEAALTPVQISLALVVWSIVAFLFEVPSGVIADKYSRKHVLVTSQVIRGLCFLTWFLLPSFAGFLAGFVLWGIRSALMSGTLEAFLYDELKEVKREKEYTKYIGRVYGMSYLGQAAAAMVAAFAIGLGHDFIFFCSFAAIITASLVTLSIPGARKADSTHEVEYFALLKEGLKFSFRTPALFGLILFSAFIQIGGALDEYWPVFGRSVGLDVKDVAFFVAAFSGVQLISSFIAYLFEHKSNRYLAFVVVIQGFLLLTAAILFSPAGLLFPILFSMLFKAVDLIFSGRLQVLVPSHIRATVSSVKGFFSEIVIVFSYLGFGFLSERVGDQAAFGFFGILIILLGSAFLLTYHHEKRRIRYNH